MAINSKPASEMTKAEFLLWQIELTCDADHFAKMLANEDGVPASQLNRNFYTIEDMQQKAVKIAAEG